MTQVRGKYAIYHMFTEQRDTETGVRRRSASGASSGSGGSPFS